MKNLLIVAALFISLGVIAQPEIHATPDTASRTLPSDTVTLSGCVCPNGINIVGYSWKVVSGPGGSSFSNTNGIVTVFKSDSAGLYSISFNAIDASGKIYPDTCQVLINPKPNKAPVAIIQPVANITLPTSTNILDGSKSMDSDGVIKNYQWIQVSGPNASTIALSNNNTTPVANLVQGAYSFRLTVTDDRGATSSATVSFTVNPAPVILVPKKVVTTVYDQNGNVIQTSTINL